MTITKKMMLSYYITLIVCFLQLHYLIHGYKSSSFFVRHVHGQSTLRRKLIHVLRESNKLDFARIENDRKNRWKLISNYEKKAVELLNQSSGAGNVEEAIQLFAKSVQLKNGDPFMALLQQYSQAVEKKDLKEAEQVLTAIKAVGFPPHIQSLLKRSDAPVATAAPPITAELVTKATEDESENEDEEDEDYKVEEVDPASNFSDTVTENIRVKVTSFYDLGKSDPKAGKYMFWYKVAIYNEGNEPVQIVARMWEIENYKGEKETVRGAGVMHTQPIIPPGEMFTYQSTCPLKLFPPKGKRILGSMSGAYTMCRGNTGQYNFTVKVSKFSFILPEPQPSSS